MLSALLCLALLGFALLCFALLNLAWLSFSLLGCRLLSFISDQVWVSKAFPNASGGISSSLKCSRFDDSLRTSCARWLLLCRGGWKVSSLSGPRVLRYVWIGQKTARDCLVVTVLISVRLSAQFKSATMHDVKIADLG